MIRFASALTALLIVFAAQTASATPVCKTGVLCGNSCISKDKVCHKTTAAPAAPAKAEAVAPAAAMKPAMKPETAMKPEPAMKPETAMKPAPAAKPAKCKDAKGKFIKCSAPGAIPG